MVLMLMVTKVHTLLLLIAYVIDEDADGGRIISTCRQRAAGQASACYNRVYIVWHLIDAAYCYCN